MWGSWGGEEKDSSCFNGGEVMRVLFLLFCFYLFFRATALSSFSRHRTYGTILSRITCSPCLTDHCLYVHAHTLSFALRTFSNGTLKHFGLDVGQTSSTLTLVSNDFFFLRYFSGPRGKITTGCCVFVCWRPEFVLPFFFERSAPPQTTQRIPKMYSLASVSLPWLV